MKSIFVLSVVVGMIAVSSGAKAEDIPAGNIQLYKKAVVDALTLKPLNCEGQPIETWLESHAFTGITRGVIAQDGSQPVLEFTTPEDETHSFWKLSIWTTNDFKAIYKMTISAERRQQVNFGSLVAPDYRDAVVAGDTYKCQN